MAHEHAHASETLGSRLLATVAINVGIVVIQLVGAVLSNSLALFTDALHNVSDVSALVLSYTAWRLGKRPANPQHTYAFKRAEVLAALVNAGALIVIAAFVVVEAIDRLRTTHPVEGLTVMVFAGIGFVANGLAALLLRGQGRSLNVRSAMLHLVSDSVGALGVLVAGFLMWRFGWYFIDPLVSLALAAWFAKEAVGIVSSAVHILLEGVPEDIEIDRLLAAIRAVPGVEDVHDVHVWALSSETSFLSAHLVVDAATVETSTAILIEVKRVLHEDFGIEHATLEAESSLACAASSDQSACPLPERATQTEPPHEH